MQCINELIETGTDWQYQAILEAAPDHFEAFVRSPRGTYKIGEIFKTRAEAEEAIKEAQEARWNG